MRVLVFRGGALGDFLVTLPALRALQRRWPGARVTLVGNRRAAELGVLDGCVQEVHDQHEGRWAPLFGKPELPEELRRWLQSFELVINYWPDPDGQLSQHFAAWGERFVAGSAQVSSRPAARHFLEPLERLGCVAEEWAPTLRLPDKMMDQAARATEDCRDLVAIHPGSGSPRKTWPLGRWHEAAVSLTRPVLWITGEADEALPPPPRVHVIEARQWPLGRVAGALAQCRFYLGHDTGISHLAAAAGAEGAVLFGPTDPAIWAPPTSRLKVLRGPNGVMDEISVSDVLAAVATRG